MDTSILITLTAQNVCQPCRTGKQRCDKSLPCCSRCASRKITCTYAREVTLLLQHRPCCLDISRNAAQELLAGARTDNSASSLPRLVSDIFDTAQVTLRDITSEYFSTIHPWLPIINQEQFCTLHQLWSQTGDASLATLIWTLFLVTRRPCLQDNHSVDNLLYQASRQMFMVQACGKLTIELLQTGLLIIYYACGHGLTRDAHMTLATCVAIAQQMGFDFTKIHDPIELVKERSACRWAIVLLDRAIALSSFIDPMPLVLPTSPAIFTEYPRLIADPNWAKCGFDVSSRVALLIGTALRYASNPYPIGVSRSTYNEAYNQVERLVQDLICASTTEVDSYLYCEGTSFAVSTLLALQTAGHNDAKPEYGTKEQLLLESTLRIVRENLRMSRSLLKESDNCGIPVVALCALSRAAAILILNYRRELTREDIQMIRVDLLRFSARWAVCGKYLKYIDEMIAESR